MEILLVAEPRERVTLSGEFSETTVKLGKVDWSREFAVVVDMGQQRTGGYSIAIRNVQVTGEGQVVLDLDVNRPQPDAFVIQVLTHPYAVARVPRGGLGSGPVTLVARDQTGAEVARKVVTL